MIVHEPVHAHIYVHVGQRTSVGVISLEPFNLFHYGFIYLGMQMHVTAHVYSPKGKMQEYISTLFNLVILRNLI